MRAARSHAVLGCPTARTPTVGAELRLRLGPASLGMLGGLGRLGAHGAGGNQVLSQELSNYLGP